MGIAKLSQHKAVKVYQEYYGSDGTYRHIESDRNFSNLKSNLHKEYIKAWFKLLNTK